MKKCEKKMQLRLFGKYKGQPVKVMQMDTGYCEWLSTQDWFRERYANVYQQVIINNFTEASETPEHNKLQMLFLDKDFYRKIEAALPVNPSKLFHPQILEAVSEIKEQVKSDENYLEELERELKIKKYYSDEENRKEKLEKLESVPPYTLEYFSIEKTLKYLRNYDESTHKEELSRLRDKIEKIKMRIQELKDRHNSIIDQRKDNTKYTYEVKTIEFELNGWDVFVGLKYKCEIDLKTEFSASANPVYQERYIEIKPCLGDDFPAVLRQMKANINKVR